MTFLEAAVEVLRRAGRPLPVRDIAALAIRHKLLTHVGRDPEGTMKARLEAELVRPPALARVTAIRPDVFTVTEAAASVPSPPESPESPEPPSAAPATASGRRRRRTRPIPTSGIPSLSARDEPAREPAAQEPEAQLRADLDAPAGTAGTSEAGGQRTRRRRRRGGRRSKRKGLASQAAQPAVASPAPAPASAPAPVAAPAPKAGLADPSPARARGSEPPMSPAGGPAPPAGRHETRSLADAAHRILRDHIDRRPLHYRQIAEMALKRKLVPTDLSDPRRAMKVALLDDLRWRRSRGLRPRFYGEAGGLFALAGGRLEAWLLEAEDRVASAARGLGDATRRALVARLKALPLEGVEQLVRRALARHSGAEPTTLERQPGHVLLAGGDGDRVLVRLQTAAPERSTLMAVGDRCRQQSVRGMLVSLADVPAAVAAQGAAAGVQILGGAELAGLLAEAGIGVVRAAVTVEYLDDDLLESLTEP